MEEDSNTRTTKEVFQGYQILLTPSQQDDATWVGEYVVTDLVNAGSPYRSGCTDDSFPSPNAARAAALLRAITIIESRSEIADTVSNILPLQLTRMTKSSYNGREIKLRSGQVGDGSWICQYTIIGLGSTQVVNLTGYPIGSYSTRDEAEAAALEVAQEEIDSDATNSSIH